jgi:hypothetical protein
VALGLNLVSNWLKMSLILMDASMSPMEISPSLTSSNPATMHRKALLPHPEGVNQDQDLFVLDIEVDVKHHFNFVKSFVHVLELDTGHGMHSFSLL